MEGNSLTKIKGIHLGVWKSDGAGSLEQTVLCQVPSSPSLSCPLTCFHMNRAFSPSSYISSHALFWSFIHPTSCGYLEMLHVLKNFISRHDTGMKIEGKEEKMYLALAMVGGGGVPLFYTFYKLASSI